MNNDVVQSLIEAALARGMIPVERRHLYDGVSPARHAIPVILEVLARDITLTGYVRVKGKSTPAFKAARSCTNFIALWVCNRLGAAAKMCEHLVKYPTARYDKKLSADADFAFELIIALRGVHWRHRWISALTVDRLHDNMLRLQDAAFRLPKKLPIHSAVSFVENYRATPMKAYYNDHSRSPDQRS